MLDLNGEMPLSHVWLRCSWGCFCVHPAMQATKRDQRRRVYSHVVARRVKVFLTSAWRLGNERGIQGDLGDPFCSLLQLGRPGVNRAFLGTGSSQFGVPRVSPSMCLLGSRLLAKLAMGVWQEFTLLHSYWFQGAPAKSKQ